MSQLLAHYPVVHAGLRKVPHPRLGRVIDGQTAVRYLRFIAPARVDYLELPRSVYGCWMPAVPTHPAHLVISVPDYTAGRWRVLRDLDLPYDPRTAGEGLRQSQSLEEMEAHFAAILRDPPCRIELGGVETDVLRVECDREHPVWPSHGECNGSPWSVPFGILDPLRAFGAGSDPFLTRFRHYPLLELRGCAPSAAGGLRCEVTPLGVFYYGAGYSIGFSLRRPLLIHLGWDALGAGQAAANRLRADNAGGFLAGLSGPLLRTFTQDFGAQHWTGEVEVSGSRVRYCCRGAAEGLEIEALFSMEAKGIHLDLTQRCAQSLPALEAEAWRLAFDLRRGMTAAAGLPSCQPGRSGRVLLPLALAGDGIGCLTCSAERAGADDWLAQVESYRSALSVTCGWMPAAQGADPDALPLLAPGEHRLSLWLRPDAFQPDGTHAARAGEGVRRNWGSVFSCIRPEYRGFSNNAASVNCHLSQLCPTEIASRTAPLAGGPDAAALARFTIRKALLDGGGYGYWRNLYLDSDPTLLICAGRLHQTHPDLAWLRDIAPGLREALGRMLAGIGAEGLIVCRDLSGNAGSLRMSANGMDVVGFGHLDAYVNALGYRALRNAAALLGELGDAGSAQHCREAAERLRAAFTPAFLNPETGWVAGWRSRDGALHDYGFIWVNGPAAAYGLLADETARQALLALEAARAALGLGDATLGLPANLLPIDPADHLMPRLWPYARPTFETFTDGSLYLWNYAYYLRALALHGLNEAANRLAAELDRGLALGYCSGGIGSGAECRSWDGLPNGYEGTLIGSFGAVYALAVQQGALTPTEPEWWPAGG